MRIHYSFVLLGIIVSGCSVTPSVEKPQQYSVSIGLRNVACQSFLGFGAEWDSRAYNAHGVTDDDLELIVKRIAWMRLPVARIMMLAKWCYMGNGKFNFASEEMNALYRHLDICQRLGTHVFLTDWGVTKNWTHAHEVRKVSNPKYAEIIGTYLNHLIHQKGYTYIRNVIMVNEPNFEAGGWKEWKSGIQNLHAVLKQNKLDAKIILTGSDCSENLRWHRMAVNQLQDVLGAYDIHLYARSEQVRYGHVRTFWETQWQYVLFRDPKAKQKPFIVGEVGMADGASTKRNIHIGKYHYGVFMADYAIQAATAGSSAIIAWMLDDNSHLNFSWGLWENKKNDFKLRPWFYPWSLLCRYVPRGSVVYRMAQPSPHLRVLAARIPKKGKDKSNDWTFCIVNRAKKPIKLTLSITEGNVMTMKRYVYSKQSTKVDEDGFPVPVSIEKHHFDQGVTVKCPNNAVVFLTSLE